MSAILYISFIWQVKFVVGRCSGRILALVDFAARGILSFLLFKFTYHFFLLRNNYFPHSLLHWIWIVRRAFSRVHLTVTSGGASFPLSF